MFGISRQAYYKRLNKNEKLIEQRAIILDLIKPIRKKMHRIGTIKIYDKIKNDMTQNNIKMGRDKFFKFLKYEKMLVPKKKNYTKTTNSFHYFYKYKNIVKDMEVNAPEQVWVSDITYIDTETGNGFLSLITDYYSKKIVGYHLADNLKTEGTLKALEMAIKSRKYPDSPLIHHSDRGIQYCSYAYIQKLTENNIKPSMTENSDPYENAIAERVNGILKDEFDIADGFINHIQAVKEISYAINTYNSFRPHFSCNMMTPDQAHLNGKYKLKKWGGRRKYSNVKSAEPERLF